MPLALLLLGLLSPPQDPVSRFGEYSGYSEERFDGWVTTSTYVQMRDGVELAVDVTRPTKGGELTDERLPVVWTHSRYHRRMGGRAMADALPPLQRLLRHGYAVAAVGVRGSGASFGRFEGLFSKSETKDAGEIIAWLAARPWCDGNVGMYGGSYLGITQYMAASLDPPALKAICPDVAAFDLYDLVYPGGVYRDDMIDQWARLTRMLDTAVPSPTVDGDEAGELRAAAIEEHAGNWDVSAGYRAERFRDDSAPGLTYLEHGPAWFLAELNEAKVPAYHFNGWFDVFVLDATLHFANFRGPEKLVIGDWSHAQSTPERMRIWSVEQHRWLDRWLKGIENGVEDDAPIHYMLMIEPGDSRWEAADAWPPPSTPTAFYFASGPSESVSSKNDGLLAPSSPEAAYDAYTIDLSTTTGSSSRWDNAVGAGAMAYTGLAKNDEKALTYTTPVLEEDLAVVGHPVVTLWVTATDGDADFHVLLEEVDDEGEVRYVTEGVLRGSHRKLSEAPWDNLGLPYQRSFEEDREPLPKDAPAEVVMDLIPTATVFDAGHRLRVVVMGADADNTEELPLEAGAGFRVFLGGEHASRIVLPVAR